MKKTPNLGLPLETHGHVATEQSFMQAMVKIDGAVGSPGSAGRALMRAADQETARAAIETGGVAEGQPDSAAENVAEIVADFNALLAKLRASGRMETGYMVIALRAENGMVFITESGDRMVVESG